MTPDEMERAIYDAFAAPYGEFVTPALAQQFAISARNAMHRIQAGMRAERIAAERARREHVRELAKLPLRDRLRTGVLHEQVG